MVPCSSLRSNDSTSIINEHACISMSVVVLQLIHKQIRIITYLNLSNDLVLMEPPLLRDWSLAEADLLEEKKNRSEEHGLQPRTGSTLPFKAYQATTVLPVPMESFRPNCCQEA